MSDSPPELRDQCRMCGTLLSVDDSLATPWGILCLDAAACLERGSRETRHMGVNVSDEWIAEYGLTDPLPLTDAEEGDADVG